VLDLSNFSWKGRIEAPKAPMGVRCGEGPEIFFNFFDLKMVNFGVF